MSSCMHLGCFLENLSTTSSESSLCMFYAALPELKVLSCPTDARDQVCKRHNEICRPFGIGGGVFRPQDPPPSYGHD